MATCGQMPATLLEMLASAIKTNNNGDIYFNAVYYDGGSEQSIASCGADASAQEAFIVANGFGVDLNGEVAIKLRKPV